MQSLILMSSPDPIGSSQAHLIVYMKLVADTLWEVQQLSSFDARRASSWASRLVQAADEMDRLLSAIPDYAAVVGPRETLDARLRACEAEQDALLAALLASIDAGGSSSRGERARAFSRPYAFINAECADVSAPPLLSSPCPTRFRAAIGGCGRASARRARSSAGRAMNRRARAESLH